MLGVATVPELVLKKLEPIGLEHLKTEGSSNWKGMMSLFPSQLAMKNQSYAFTFDTIRSLDSLQARPCNFLLLLDQP